MCVCVCVCVCVDMHVFVCVSISVSVCAALLEAIGCSDRGADKSQKAVHGRHVTHNQHISVADIKLYKQRMAGFPAALWCNDSHATGALCTQLAQLVYCEPN